MGGCKKSSIEYDREWDFFLMTTYESTRTAAKGVERKPIHYQTAHDLREIQEVIHSKGVRKVGFTLRMQYQGELTVICQPAAINIVKSLRNVRPPLALNFQC